MTSVLGAEPADGGTRFTVVSAVADRVELVLFDETGRGVAEHRDLVSLGDGDWSLHAPDVGPGRCYGYRVHGPGDRTRGHACDPGKVLVDPAARRLSGALQRVPELLEPGAETSALVPRSVVVAPGVASRLASPTPWDRTVIYEAHVGHLTARHPGVAEAHRGRFPGLAAPPVIEHLRRLGVTAVELLPVQHFVSEAELVARGAANVWGYNPLAWGAPHEGYATDGGDPVAELRAAVAALHDAGIEVLLDVVFNHTAEGSSANGPVLSWRGFDNAAAYRLRHEGDRLVDDDVTGCGNTVDTRSPWIRRLVVQCLERWVLEFGIDGFRFDLAPALLRGEHGPDWASPLLHDLDDLVRRHPGLKLIAEPWDVGPGGYALGRFPRPWREWNDRFRTEARALWAGGGSWPALADGLMGSGAVYGGTGRAPGASVNAVATHDGFTLADLVTYDQPAAGGHGQLSWGGGVDGPTDDAAVLAGRRRRQRCLLGTVLCAQGVPLLLAGDELGRSQAGTADGYTLDPSTWGLDWDAADRDLAAWTAAAVDVRRRHRLLRRAERIEPGDHRVTWLDDHGGHRDEIGWADRQRPYLGVDLADPDTGERLLVLVVADAVEVEVSLPEGAWQIVLDARDDRPPAVAPEVTDRVLLDGPCLVVLAPEGTDADR